MKVKHASTEQLLAEIINRSVVGPGPRKSTYEGVWHECSVGIGNDHTASIRLDDESMQRLLHRTS